jgi:hypothetical protein
MLLGILPIIKIGAMVLVGGAIVIGIGYYLLIVMRRKKWFIRIFEMMSDGRMHLIGFDELIERRFDNGRVICYWLNKCKAETTPPPAECVDRVGTKNFADYIRIRHTYVPIKKAPTGDTRADMMRMPELMAKATSAIKTDKKYRMGTFDRPNMAEQRFIYVPLNRVPHVKVGFNQLDYDVDVMRINAIDNLDKMFSSQKTFWEKYGMYMLIGFMVVAIIVVAYLAFEFMRDVITQNLASTNGVVEAIKGLNVGGGTKPPV